MGAAENNRELAGKAPVREGDILAGKYRVDKVLGVGGMGVVVAARHIHLDEKVAIKFLLEEMLESRDAVERFAWEARAAVKNNRTGVSPSFSFPLTGYLGSSAVQLRFQFFNYFPDAVGVLWDIDEIMAHAH